MKFGDFLFPESSDPACDGEIIDEALAEARLCDELGMDAIWLAEHQAACRSQQYPEQGPMLPQPKADCCNSTCKETAPSLSSVR